AIVHIGNEMRQGTARLTKGQGRAMKLRIPFEMRGRTVAPTEFPIVLTARRAFPFRFVGQAPANPCAIRICLVPSNIDDGEIISVQTNPRTGTYACPDTRL